VNTELREKILECLHQHGQPATYGSIAGLVDTSPQRVMSDLERNHRNSWVINSKTLLPTYYLAHQIDPRFSRELAKSSVIRNSEDLSRWLQKSGCGTKSKKTKTLSK
jgi:hypothetical protein